MDEKQEAKHQALRAETKRLLEADKKGAWVYFVSAVACVLGSLSFLSVEDYLLSLVWFLYAAFCLSQIRQKKKRCVRYEQMLAEDDDFLASMRAYDALREKAAFETDKVKKARLLYQAQSYLVGLSETHTYLKEEADKLEAALTEVRLSWAEIGIDITEPPDDLPQA